jgi:hypothetical protein
MTITRIETPSTAERKWFGVMAFAFFALVGAILSWRLGTRTAAYVLWGFGAALALLYYSIRPLQVPLYKGWMHLVSPVGWVVSHLLLGLIYFGVVTPIGVCMRLFGRDKLERRFVALETYWTAHPTDIEPGRYFRQS